MTTGASFSVSDNLRTGGGGTECSLDSCEESYSGLGVDRGRAMLERVGTTVTVLTDWRGRRPPP